MNRNNAAPLTGPRIHVDLPADAFLERIQEYFAKRNIPFPADQLQQQEIVTMVVQSLITDFLIFESEYNIEHAIMKSVGRQKLQRDIQAGLSEVLRDHTYTFSSFAADQRRIRHGHKLMKQGIAPNWDDHELGKQARLEFKDHFVDSARSRTLSVSCAPLLEKLYVTEIIHALDADPQGLHGISFTLAEIAALIYKHRVHAKHPTSYLYDNTHAFFARWYNNTIKLITVKKNNDNHFTFWERDLDSGDPLSKMTKLYIASEKID